MPFIDKVKVEYKNEFKECKIEEFDLEYSACEFKIETEQISITLDKFHFEELRNKMNRLHDEVIKRGQANE